MSINEMEALHDRATRGETLSADEQARLNAWYESEDKAEGEAFELWPHADFSDDLRKKAEEAFARLSAALQRAQTLAAQNEVLRQENDHLRQRLAPAPRAA